MSNDSTTNNYKQLTFPSLMKGYDKIIIPMIQRDYAQGRTDKKAQEVRTKLLNDIFDEEKESIFFDLIFGSCEKRYENGRDKQCFIPVDGQQRLTTLFLLYLYAQKTEQHIEGVDLSKFSYDTRRAAADFCKNVTSEEWTIVQKRKVSDIIKDSVWFMNYWENDPTVAGMLNMLDAIHEKAEGRSLPNLEKIQFYFFDLESNGLNENLYLMMNSRGKPLTAFENLKAKIEKLLKDSMPFDKKWFPEDDVDATKDEFKETWKYYMDRSWAETFWDKDNPEKYDVYIAEFIVRFLSGYWAAFSVEEESVNEISLKKINNQNSYVDFIPFEPIEKVLNLENAFPRLAYALTTIIDDSKIKPYWSKNNDEIKVSEKSEYKIIAVVFTTVLFDGDNAATRFAWNMAENYVTGYDTYIAYCKRVKEMHDYSCIHNVGVCQTLKDKEFKNPSEQLKEEIVKAKQILDENGNLCKYKGTCKKEDMTEYKTWDDVILEAESYAFFRGSIRFLYQGANGNPNWDDFDIKWMNAKKYFAEHPKSGETVMREEYKNANLLKALISRFSSQNYWDVLNYSHRTFNNKPETWKYYLLNDKIYGPIHDIMTGNTNVIELNKSSIEADNRLYQLSNTNLLDFVIDKIPNSWIREYHGHKAIFPSGTGIFLDAETRDNLLTNTAGIECKEDHIVEKTNFLYGSNINFKYNDYFFQWYGNPNANELDVYLMKDNWTDYIKRPNSNNDKKTDEETDDIRYVAVINEGFVHSEEIDDYGFVAAKCSAATTAAATEENIKLVQKGAPNTTSASCKETSNQLCGDFGSYNNSSTKYK